MYVATFTQHFTISSVYCGENEESQTNKKEHIKGVDIYYKQLNVRG